MSEPPGFSFSVFVAPHPGPPFPAGNVQMQKAKQSLSIWSKVRLSWAALENVAQMLIWEAAVSRACGPWSQQRCVGGVAFTGASQAPAPAVTPLTSPAAPGSLSTSASTSNAPCVPRVASLSSVATTMPPSEAVLASASVDMCPGEQTRCSVKTVGVGDGWQARPSQLQSSGSWPPSSSVCLMTLHSRLCLRGPPAAYCAEAKQGLGMSTLQGSPSSET